MLPKPVAAEQAQKSITPETAANEVTINLIDSMFLSAPLTKVVIDRKKMLERCNFERKGAEMIVRGL